MPRPSMAGGLRVWEWAGDPPDTVLMHGIGNYGRYWDFMAEAVAGRLRLIAPDARGHGESMKPDAAYEPSDFADDVVTVLDAMRVERAVIVGHSMGGFHATALVNRHPERVRALVLVDVGHRVADSGERARRLSLGRPDRFADERDALAYLRETSPGYSEFVYANRLAWLFARDDRGLTWRSSKPALARILETRRTSEAVWARLSEIRCPVLIVRGTRSETFSAEIAREMLAELPDARAIELDARHNVPLDRPRELADAVVAFAKASR